MSRVAAGQHGGHGWQLILADLALILFLLTLSALPAVDAETRQKRTHLEARGQERGRTLGTEIAAAQALFRPLPGGPSLGEWLSAQAPDPRATLTIFAVHTRGGEAAAWARAQALAAEARSSGATVRMIITAGAKADLYASLAYDEMVAGTQNRNQSS